MSNTLQFYGLPHENPNTHISRFLKNCQNCHAPRVNEDAIKLRLFPYTLRDATLEWLDSKPDGSGSIIGKSVQQCMDLFELIATTHSMFSSERVVPPKVAGIYELDSIASTNAQIAALTKQVELLVKSQTKRAHAVITGPSYENCRANHLIENCNLWAFRRNKWLDNQKGNSSNNAQQEKKSSLGEMFNQYMQKTDKLAERPQGILPSNTLVNPKEQVQAITTRNGVQLLEIHVKRPNRKDKEVMSEEIGTEAESEQPTNEEDKRKEALTVKAPSPRKKLDKQFAKFGEIFKKLHINIPFTDAIAQMPSYAKFLKGILSNKRKLEEYEAVCQNEECSAILLKKLPPKLKDLGNFTIPCTTGSNYFEHSLCDLGSSVNLMPLSIYKSLELGEIKYTTISLQLTDRSIKRSKEIIEDVLVKVDKFIFPADFIILDMEEDLNIPLILGRPFLATGRALIDVYDGKMILRVDNEQVIFNVFKVIKHPLTFNTCCQIDVLEKLVANTFETEHHTNLCEAKLAQPEATNAGKAELEKTLTLELKPLPSHLHYAYSGDSTTLPVIIANDMTREEENKLLEILK
ncbi:uncharacterized protein LOC111385354 [Olea europaea var. sylvestris]|uniref:uncharacterized protein LOC111385354 n=1 Tax=Olea europaea var. sylvestris TaxID=158386 RepID=UPI000C1D2C4E|nr:uncharacterized protein LOC111385354 [Olea europaea var. sylvestris]